MATPGILPRHAPAPLNRLPAAVLGKGNLLTSFSSDDPNSRDVLGELRLSSALARIPAAGSGHPRWRPGVPARQTPFLRLGHAWAAAARGGAGAVDARKRLSAGCWVDYRPAIGSSAALDRAHPMLRAASPPASIERSRARRDPIADLGSGSGESPLERAGEAARTVVPTPSVRTRDLCREHRREDRCGVAGLGGGDLRAAWGIRWSVVRRAPA